MKKSDLKTGMRIVFANGDIGIVLADVDVIGLEGGGYLYISELDNSLQYCHTREDEGWFVTKIFKGYTNNAQVLNFAAPGELLWERQEVKSESEKQLDAVMAKLTELQKEAEQLQETIKKEKK